MTSGYPRRRSRWESSFANPRSWYGRSRRASIAWPTVTFPSFRSRRSACTRRRSTALPEAFRFSRVRGHVSAVAREVQLEDRIEVPHRAINHDAGDALHEARVRGELAPDRRRPTADVDHDDVAGLRAIDRLDGFRPVATRALDGQRPAHALPAILDPPHAARHPAPSPPPTPPPPS